MTKPTAIVYVDGFNLYRRALVGTPYKWLDLEALFSHTLQEFEVVKIKYFTARIQPKPHEKSQHIRQNIYLRALQTNPLIEIEFGKFSSETKSLPKSPWEYDINGIPLQAKVKVHQEKGSDVNRATNLVFDVLKRRADALIVVTNDSDQVGPLRKLKNENEGLIGLILTSKEPAVELMGIGLPIVRQIREGILSISQLPDELSDAVGIIRKPSSW